MSIRNAGRLACALSIFSSLLAAQTGVYVLKAARLFDSTSGKMVEPGTIVVSGSVIQSVGGQAAPPGAATIDLGDATLLPGFIDAHTHLTMDFNPDYNGAMLIDLQRPSPNGRSARPSTRAKP